MRARAAIYTRLLPPPKLGADGCSRKKIELEEEGGSDKLEVVKERCFGGEIEKYIVCSNQTTRHWKKLNSWIWDG